MLNWYLHGLKYISDLKRIDMKNGLYSAAISNSPETENIIEFLEKRFILKWVTSNQEINNLFPRKLLSPVLDAYTSVENRLSCGTSISAFLASFENSQRFLPNTARIYLKSNMR